MTRPRGGQFTDDGDAHTIPGTPKSWPVEVPLAAVLQGGQGGEGEQRRGGTKEGNKGEGNKGEGNKGGTKGEQRCQEPFLAKLAGKRPSKVPDTLTSPLNFTPHRTARLRRGLGDRIMVTSPVRVNTGSPKRPPLPPHSPLIRLWQSELSVPPRRPSVPPDRKSVV